MMWMIWGRPSSPSFVSGRWGRIQHHAHICISFRQIIEILSWIGHLFVDVRPADQSQVFRTYPLINIQKTIEKTPLLIGKSTISMGNFRYVELPEGRLN